MRIVLVRPSHPGNIGSVARAMKVMGFSELYLVSPERYPDPDAVALATHAQDILNNVVIVHSVLEALINIDTVYATSANHRAADLPCFSPREIADNIYKNSRNNNTQNNTAILFGPENHGLSNDDLQYAQALLQIPTSPDYHSLNLAAAVQIVVYELYLAQCESREQECKASLPELEKLYDRLETVAHQTGFLDPKRPGQLMTRFRRLFNRAHLDKVELNILMGFLKEINDKLCT